MFRLLPRGLPRDPVFPHSLKELGYFINEQDEIRNIKEPNTYFKYFIDRNERTNIVQREAMNACIRKEVTARLLGAGMSRFHVPFESPAGCPHTHILISSNLHTTSRVVILFNEDFQDLGILALRVIGGPGGINKGSAVNFVRALQRQRCSAEDGSPPGIIIANCGQLMWSRRVEQPMTRVSWSSQPQPSSVHNPKVFDAEKNTIPGNRNAVEHIDYVMNTFVRATVKKNVKLDVVAVSGGCDKFIDFLEVQANWERWAPQLNSLSMLAPYHRIELLKNDELKKFLLKRGRAYGTGGDEFGAHLCGPNGGNGYMPSGSPTYSLACWTAELMLPNALDFVLGWIQKVALDEGYENEDIADIEGTDESDSTRYPATSGDEKWGSGSGGWENRGWEKTSENDTPMPPPAMSESLQKALKKAENMPGGWKDTGDENIELGIGNKKRGKEIDDDKGPLSSINEEPMNDESNQSKDKGDVDVKDKEPLSSILEESNDAGNESKGKPLSRMEEID